MTCIRKLRIVYFIILHSWVGLALADGQYVCVEDATGGLNWNGSSWSLTNFNKKNVLIKIYNNGTRLDYRAAGDPIDFKFACTRSPHILSKSEYLYCTDQSGSLILFDEALKIGGVSSLIGSVMPNFKYRDSLSVTQLTCQKF